MKLAAYDALIARLEESAQRDPRWYRIRVGLVAGLGYTVVSLALLLGLTVMGLALFSNWWALQHHHVNAGVIKLGVVFTLVGGGLCWAVLRGVWVIIPPPAGVVVSRAQAPDLFDEVERLRVSMGAPPVDRIVIDANFNAMLAQRPLLGLFGWYRTYLVLGLPLLRQFSVPQARSVIAHELGHLHGQDGRFGVWIYRLRNTWGTLAERVGGWKLMRWFLNWYAPLFNAYSFVLARQQERHADHLAAQASTAEAAASALAKAAIAGRLSQRFWSGLFLRAAKESAPPVALWDELDRALSVADPRTQRWMGEELRRSNDRNDPHPCLRERLESFGCSQAAWSSAALATVQPSQSAAFAWLRQFENELAQRFSAEWIAEHGSQWQAHHEQAQDWQRQREELEAKAATNTITIEERWSLAIICINLEGLPAAQPAVEAVLQAKPDHAPALYVLGKHLLEEGDARGVPLLQAAMHHDPEAVRAVSALLSDFADTQGHADLKRQAEAQGEARAEIEAQAAAERSRMPKAKELVPHQASTAILARIQAVLSQHDKITAADLARVEVQYLPDQPYFVLAITIHVAWWKFRSATANQALITQVLNQLCEPGLGALFWLVIDGTGHTAGVAKAVRKQADARVYTRGA